jgi:hypothetical protein
MKTRLLVTAGLAAAISAACGGGGDAPAAMSDNRVPASATVSVEAFSAYIASLAVDDAAEPLIVDAVEPPLSETGEPVAVV